MVQGKEKGTESPHKWLLLRSSPPLTPNHPLSSLLPAPVKDLPAPTGHLGAIIMFLTLLSPFSIPNGEEAQ